MPLSYHSRKLAPKIAHSSIYVADLGSANAVTQLTVPAGAIACSLWFDDGSDEKIRGRVGFVNADQTATVPTTIADADDDDFGHQSAQVDYYDITSWAQILCVACPTANAVLYGTWYHN